MALNFNKIMLGGRLTDTPELKRTSSDISVTRFTLAVNRRFTKQGEQPQADFIDVVCWRNTAEFVSKYFTKGSAMFVVGSLQTRVWKDNDGKSRKSVEVVADEVSFVESRSSASASPSGGYSQIRPGNNVPSGFDGFDFDGPDGFSVGAGDDELPF